MDAHGCRLGGGEDSLGIIQGCHQKWREWQEGFTGTSRAMPAQTAKSEDGAASQDLPVSGAPTSVVRHSDSTGSAARRPAHRVDLSLPSERLCRRRGALSRTPSKIKGDRGRWECPPDHAAALGSPAVGLQQLLSRCGLSLLPGS